MGMLGCKPGDALADLNQKLVAKEGSVPIDKWRYHRLVGRLIYLSYTWSDMVYFVEVVTSS